MMGTIVHLGLRFAPQIIGMIIGGGGGGGRGGLADLAANFLTAGNAAKPAEVNTKLKTSSDKIGAVSVSFGINPEIKI